MLCKNPEILIKNHKTTCYILFIRKVTYFPQIIHSQIIIASYQRCFDLKHVCYLRRHINLQRKIALSCYSTDFNSDYYLYAIK